MGPCVFQGQGDLVFIRRMLLVVRRLTQLDACRWPLRSPLGGREASFCPDEFCGFREAWPRGAAASCCGSTPFSAHHRKRPAESSFTDSCSPQARGKTISFHTYLIAVPPDDVCTQEALACSLGTVA